MNDDVMTQLKRHLASAEQIDVSRYQFVNMDRVRDAAGDRWPEWRERSSSPHAPLSTSGWLRTI
ncbi:MAG: hypothetical protein JKP95_00620 [Oceanicaulis sp.]|nr:hypothetical protein [Oceanicaulis sp.]